MTDEVQVAAMEAIRKELREIVREVIREELHDVGLRSDTLDSVDEAREDFRFLRRLRKAMDGIAAKIGYTILAMITGGMIIALWIGIKVHVLKS